MKLWILYCAAVLAALYALDQPMSIYIALLYVGAFELFARELMRAPISEDDDD